MKNPQACMLSFLGGMVLGAAIVALTTPKTGKELRGTIRKTVDDGMDLAREKADKGRRNVKSLKTKVREGLVEKLESMAEAAEARK